MQIIAGINRGYIVFVLIFAGGLFAVVPKGISQIGALIMPVLLLAALKYKIKQLAYPLTGSALISHHCLLAAIVRYESLDADTLTAFVINAAFLYAPVLPNPFVAIPATFSLSYYFYSYNGGVFSVAIAEKMFVTLLIAATVSTGIWLYRNLAEQRDKYYQASITDGLTGLYTFTHAVAKGQELLADGSTVTVLLFDLNNFKTINDTFGHIAGNTVLTQFAGSLRASLAQEAIIARMGGDEFLVIINQGENNCSNLEFIEGLKNQNYIVDPDLIPIDVTFSYGVARHSTGDRGSIQDLINLADQDMYCNKAEKNFSDHFHIKMVLPVQYQELINVLAQKDVYTYVHSYYVARYSAMLAGFMGLSPEYVADITIAGWLHDIGKIIIPNEILRKHEQLTDAEYELMKTHVLVSINLLRTYSLNQSVLQAIASHHEHYNGYGYPQGCKATAIPLAGRILAVADAFSAMTVKRVYRKQLSAAAALAELRRQRGAQFDPEIVDQFITVIEKAVLLK